MSDNALRAAISAIRGAILILAGAYACFFYLSAKGSRLLNEPSYTLRVTDDFKIQCLDITNEQDKLLVEGKIFVKDKGLTNMVLKKKKQ